MTEGRRKGTANGGGVEAVNYRMVNVCDRSKCMRGLSCGPVYGG